MQSRTNQSQSIGSLFQANIFGNPANGNVSVKPAYQSKKTPTKRPEKVIFEEVIKDLSPVVACWPMLTKEARAMTMDNFRLERAIHNNRVEALNEEIEKYNAQVENFCAGELNEVQKQFPLLFLKNVKLVEKKLKYEAKEYNLLVEEFNNDRGMLLKKRKEETLKYPSEQVFENLLHLYAKQLAQYTKEYMKLSISEPSTVRPFDANSYHVTALERQNDTETFVYSLPVCNATVRNHRRKLERAGFFTHYCFAGHKKGVKMHFSPKILVLFDAKTGNFTNTENQAVTPQTSKEFTDKNKAFTRTSIKVDNTENGQADFPVLGTPAAGLPSFFYKNIQAQDEKSKLGAAPANVKVSQNRTDFLRNHTLADKNLATRLASGEFHNYKRIDFEVLEKEAYSGTLTRPEKMELVKHEFFKYLSRIYRGSTPYAGTYQKALVLFEDEFYVSNGNGKFLISKDMMVDKLKEWVWRINFAQRWFLKRNWRPLNPHDYLDKTRTDKKEIGFGYTKKAYLKHLKEKEKQPIKAAIIKKNAAIRKAKINYSNKYHAIESRFFNNKITIEELITYVKDNLPANYMQEITNSIKKRAATQYTC
ncbi:hypothetical protein ACM55F_10105 [Flavobacterium sp. XS2P12]|uniref:hypothetical protein n=1 Tax=Flavobacterium melibiosi TaxID=3398734 RepID=UPI003A879FA0